MKIDFNTIDEITVPGMNHGTGTMTAKMYMGEVGKIIPCRILREARLECTSIRPAMILTMCCQARVLLSAMEKRKNWKAEFAIFARRVPTIG